MKLNTIYNEDCLLTMQKMDERSIDMVMTSPPYNTSRKGSSLNAADSNIRYDAYNDMMPNDEYIDWTTNIFNSFDRVLKPNGSVLYNLSYSAENTDLMWLVVSEIIRRTPFTAADCIVWKKRSAVPVNESPNKLTRICEFVFVFCRKEELPTFFANKEQASVRGTGQVMYKNYFNFVEAPNNDENCPIHKATYSTILCRKLIDLYCPRNGIVYDPFMGTGTTAIAAIRENRQYIGSEISERYCEWAGKRIERETSQLSLFWKKSCCTQ